MSTVAKTEKPIQNPDSAATALTFFKVMAVIVGIGLLLLTVEVVLHFTVGPDNALSWWPQPHGFIYFVYLIATANLGFKVGWSLPKMVLIMLAGCVPFLSFVVEHYVAREIDGRLAAARQ